MAIEKMKLIKTVGQRQYLDEVLKVFYESKCYHIEPPEKLISSKGLSTLKEKNPYAFIFEKLNSIIANLKYIPENTDEMYSGIREETENYLTELDNRTGELASIKNELNGEIADYKQTLSQINHLGGLDANFEDVVACKEVKVKFGKLPVDSYPKLSYYSSDDIMFEVLDKDDEYYWGMYFAPSFREQEIDAIFNSMYFEPMNVPNYLFGSADKAINGMKKLIETTEEEKERIDSKLNDIIKAEKQKLDAINSYYTYENEIFGLRKNAVIYSDTFFVFGFVPEKEADLLIKQADKVSETFSSVVDEDGEINLMPPTKLKNNALVRPFEQIVKMYGIPKYGEIDPTTYVAIVYTLLFGIMFGDLGQGLVIFLIGLILSKWKKIEFGKILERIGISSAVFGFLYGSVFGFEDALDPLYTNVFGWNGKPIDVFEQSNTLLLAAIVLGAVLIVISILLNIIIGIRRRDYENAIFGPNGIAGMVFYVSVLSGLALRFLFDKNVLKPLYVLSLLIIPLLLIFFKQPLGNLISKKKNGEKIKIGEFIAENFFEMFEYVLSYATNTMSFLRVGGFILSHAGMMLVVMTLAKMMSAAASPVVIIIGNTFVMGLEGLIVGIQALRLQFYEVFGRFFDGDGKEFEPIGTKIKE